MELPSGNRAERLAGPPHQFFVYGTLKRGQQRGGAWPRQPVCVQDAWTTGLLYAGPDYPAMRACPSVAEVERSATRRLSPANTNSIKKNRVRGELWTFSALDTAAVIQRLDAIEGTDRPGVANLYDRFIAQVFDDAGRCLGVAWVYTYAKHPEDDGFRRVTAPEFQAATWPCAGHRQSSNT